MTPRPSQKPPPLLCATWAQTRARGALEAPPAGFEGVAGSPALESVDNALNLYTLPYALNSPKISPLGLPSVLSPCAITCLHLLRDAGDDGGSLRPAVRGADAGGLRRDRNRQVPPAVVWRVQRDCIGQSIPDRGGEASIHSREAAKEIPARSSHARLERGRAGGIGVDPEDKRRRRNGTKERVGTKTSVAEHQQQHVCGHCQNSFWSSRPWAKWCSSSCRMRAAYQRKWQVTRPANRSSEDG